MGKILRGKRSISSSDSAGCSWGMLHLIKYHQWHHVKKTLTYKRRNTGAHAPTEGEVSSPLWNSSDLHTSGINASSADKMPTQDDATVDQSIVEGEVAKPSTGKKGSVKARIKAFISEDMYKKKGRHHRSASCPVASSAQRDSLHQLKPADCPFVEMVLTDASPSIFHQNTNTSSDDNKLDSDSLPINTSKETITCNKSGDCDNIIATLNLEHDHVHFTTHQQKFVNKTRMVKQKSTSAINANSLLPHSKEYLDALDIISVNKDLLLKILHDPGSPLAQCFHDQHTLSSKKGLTKSDSFPLPGSLRRASQPSKLKYNQGKGKLEDYSHPQKSLLPISSKRIYEHSMSSTGSSQHLGNQGEDKVVSRPRFKDLKQKIKHFIKEGRKERHRVALDSILHKVPRGQKFSEDLEKAIDGQMKDPEINGEGKDDHSCNYSSNKNHMHQMRRASSFNESMDRYRHLYETTFREEGKNHTFERPKMRTKEANSSLNGVPKYLGRILSLPNIKSRVYENEESLNVGEMELTSVANNKREIQLDSHLNIVGNIMEDIGMNAESTVKSRLNTPDNSIEQIYEPKAYLSEASDDGLQMKKEETTKGESLNDDLSHFEIDSTEFSYVRDILKLSGFSGNASLRTWHSNDRPVVDPLVYEEVEGCLIHDPHCSGNDGGKCNNLLLFDLVNEVLIEIYGRSYSYCPIPLSSLCHIRPMPISYHVLKEVWVLISGYLSLRPEADQAVDQVVSCDLAKNDGWMNLQFESECVGLELEDMILDDLLEELIWN